MAQTPLTESLLLEVRGLTVKYGATTALRGISIELEPGEILSLVGESGCGKSTTALAIPQLLPAEADIVAGQILYRGRDMLTATRRELENLRGKEIGMIYQDPLSALNPVLTVGHQIMETIRRHTSATRSEARARAMELLDLVEIPDSANAMKRYPHQFSGGMRQRIVIAIAISCQPRLLIADEPTTALDVSIQAQVLGLLKQLVTDMNMAMLLITHDLHVAASMADRIEVMYDGEVVERGMASVVLARPQHPYTQKLRAAIPELSMSERMDFSFATVNSSMLEYDHSLEEKND